MFKKSATGLIFVLLFFASTQSVFALDPTNQSTWPFSIDVSGVYYTFVHANSVGESSTCYSAGPVFGSCYWLVEYNKPVCDISTSCNLMKNTSWGNGNELRVNISYYSDDVIDLWYYRGDTDVWVSYHGSIPNNALVIDSRFPFYQSVQSSMGGFRYDSSGSNSPYSVKSGYNLGTSLVTSQNVLGAGSSSCNVLTYFNDSDPGGIGLDHIWYLVKLFFWKTFSPSCFLNVSQIGPVKDLFNTKAPFAYVSAIFTGQNLASISEASNSADILFPLTAVSGVSSFHWIAPSFMSSAYSSVKAVISVLIWLGFVVYLWHLPGRVITK